MKPCGFRPVFNLPRERGIMMENRVYSAIQFFKEPLIKSRLAAWHASRLHFFPHSAQLSFANRQIGCTQSLHSDEKIDCTICAPDLIRTSLKYMDSASTQKGKTLKTPLHRQCRSENFLSAATTGHSGWHSLGSARGPRLRLLPVSPGRRDSKGRTLMKKKIR